jgi:hypothetical protein
MKKIRNVELVILFLWACVMVVFMNYAWATTPQPKQEQNQGQDQGQHQTSTADANSNSTSIVTASNDGNELSVDGDQFYALSLMFPSASGCFSGVQGGGADNDSGGFLGFHVLNKSCWADKLASQEQDIEINARLKCSDKKYRNALAYDLPRKDRQSACVAMKVKSGTDLVKKLREDLAFIENERAIERQACNESKNRIVEASKESTERAIDACNVK